MVKNNSFKRQNKSDRRLNEMRKHSESVLHRLARSNFRFSVSSARAVNRFNKNGNPPKINDSFTYLQVFGDTHFSFQLCIREKPERKLM